MSEQKKYDKIEDAIVELLDGELRENALNFAAYLKENGMTPDMPQKSDFIYGKVPFNGKYIGWILVKENKWSFEIFNFISFGEFKDDDVTFNELIHEHVNFCSSCCIEHGCLGGQEVKIFGKEFTNVCCQHSHGFENPDAETVRYIKKLIEYSKQTEPNDNQYHPNNL